MNYTKEQIKNMTWPEWNEAMAKELNEAGFRTRGFNSETGRWESNRDLYKPHPTDPETFILGQVEGANEINYLKNKGLLNNGRCPMCGGPINGIPARFTSGYDQNVHFQICQKCCNKGRRTSLNPDNNTGCMLALILFPWHLIKSIF
ncbi:MAG: hypothetical protein K2H61_00895 [Muribaculaceae bacterium]|nr:hypothetical protein [Muribaculaceae bacterium]